MVMVGKLRVDAVDVYQVREAFNERFQIKATATTRRRWFSSKQANLYEVDANAVVPSLFDIGMQESDKVRAEISMLANPR